LNYSNKSNLKMKKQDWTRRHFIQQLSLTGATLSVLPFASWSSKQPDQQLKNLVDTLIGVDTHNHMDLPYDAATFNKQRYDLAGQLKQSGLTAICMTCSVDRPALLHEGEAYERFLANLNEMDELLIANNLVRALTYADLQKSKKENKPLVIQSVEGGHFIEGKLERIQAAHARGLRVLGLMHDGQTSPPIGDIYTEAPQYNGLTPLGLDIIRECNKLGILIDLTHCSNDAIKQALGVSTKPMIISHTGLATQLGTNEKMAKMMLPRLISKEQAKSFAQAGGLIGVWTHLADTPLDYAKNIRAMVDVVGVEHVCLGTDTKMALANTSQERKSMQTNSSWENSDQGFLYVVVDSLLRVGFTEKEIRQISGENFCMLFAEATKVN